MLRNPLKKKLKTQSKSILYWSFTIANNKSGLGIGVS